MFNILFLLLHTFPSSSAGSHSWYVLKTDDHTHIHRQRQTCIDTHSHTYAQSSFYWCGNTICKWSCVRKIFENLWDTKDKRQKPCHLCFSLTWVVHGICFCVPPGWTCFRMPIILPLLFRMTFSSGSWPSDCTQSSCDLAFGSVYSLNPSELCSITLPNPQNTNRLMPWITMPIAWDFSLPQF